MSAAATATRSSWHGGGISLLFWLSLLLAVAMYSGVALAPKLITVRALSTEHRQQQARLLHLEQQTEQLDRVVQALQQDPQFAAEIARLEFDARRPGEEVVSVDARLKLTPVAAQTPSVVALETTVDDAWSPWLQLLTYHHQLRAVLLGTAATLVILSFTFLHDPTSATSAPTSAAAPVSLSTTANMSAAVTTTKTAETGQETSPRTRGQFWQRYRKPTPPPQAGSLLS